MPPKGARIRKANRDKVKEDKEKKRRLGRERGIESRARKRSYAEFYNADVALE